jgi:hypothetical protein
MACVGIDFCSQKNCLEQERCVGYIVSMPKKGPKKKKNKHQDPRINACQMHKKFCSNARACEILGQCILDHPLVKADKQATKALRKPSDINQIIRVIEKLMPSLNRSKRKTKKIN